MKFIRTILMPCYLYQDYREKNTPYLKVFSDNYEEISVIGSYLNDILKLYLIRIRIDYRRYIGYLIRSEKNGLLNAAWNPVRLLRQPGLVFIIRLDN